MPMNPMADKDLHPADRLPRHVAMIMDGNGRWARKRFLPRFAGHKAGMETVRAMVKACLEKGIGTLTLFAFSSENWRRPAEEVGLLMKLFMTALEREVSKLHEHGVRLRIIGDRSAFPQELQRRIAEAEQLTADNHALNLVIAANYGGRWDIAEAARKLAEAARAGQLDPAEITPDRIAAELSLADLPEPDLFVRTGGEQRVSNFLLWQLAYAELYFTPILWPDFDTAAFEDALASFATRQRRFGRTGEQVEQSTGA
jgi:undecaprenyl diphosphate synthase